MKDADVECPYCGEWNEVCHDDGMGYDENINEMQCIHCEMNFVFSTGIIYVYSSEKAECLNGGDHDYKTPVTIPIEATKMQCSMCGYRRDCTKDEMNVVIENRNLRILKKNVLI